MAGKAWGALACCFVRPAHPAQHDIIDLSRIGESNHVIAHASSGLCDQAFINLHVLQINAELKASVGSRSEHDKLALAA